MKKGKILLVTMILCALMLGGCGNSAATQKAEDGKYEIICTTFPQYDWVKNLIAGNEDSFTLTLLTEKGGDLHNFQPSATDIAKISNCDLLIYVGGESDAWVSDTLRTAQNTDMHVINMMDVIRSDLKEEELVEGMQAEEHHHDEDEHHDKHEYDDGHEHDEDEHHNEHEEIEYDEHIWLSLKNAQKLVKGISTELQALDAANASLYEKNETAYMDELNKLNQEYQSVVAAAQKDTLLFADRFPFRYLVDDYAINYYAAFVGCSAETEASFETVAFLAGKIDELNLDTILVIDGSDEKLAKAIIDNTSDKNQQILVLDSMQSVSKKDIEDGETYLSSMSSNLDILRQALGEK